MPLIEYQPWRPQAAARKTLDQALEVIRKYQAQRIKMTLRQLYYQLVAGGHIPNKMSEYKRLGEIVSRGRLAGLIDWEAIEDRGRSLNGLNTWDAPGSFVSSMTWRYHEDLWADQDNRVEVWVEKEALVGVIGRPATRWRCDYFACKGYTSQTAMWEASRRFRDYMEEGQNVVVIHLGDHDPSGIDMTRDIDDRQEMFWADVTVDRIALNMDQVRRYDPPPNPAKMSDSRAPDYVAQFGSSSWELDALEPSLLDDLIEGAIMKYIDVDKFEALKAAEEENTQKLRQLASRWDDVSEYLEGTDDDEIY